MAFDGGGQIVGDGLVLGNVTIGSPLCIYIAGIGNGLPITDLVLGSTVLANSGARERGNLGRKESRGVDSHCSGWNYGF